jgi:hypothetical protein
LCGNSRNISGFSGFFKNKVIPGILKKRILGIRRNFLRIAGIFEEFLEILGIFRNF